MAADPHPDPEIWRQVLAKIEDELGTCAIHVNRNYD
jgi:DNA-binding helix-hairpin-helix protein with protein kinase domain